jgi:hypothetical protein
MALCAAPSFALDAPHALNPMLASDAVPFLDAYQAPEVGPLRDPEGPDWITYDDGTGPSYYYAPRLYARTRFAPNAEFELRAVSVCPGNWNNSNAVFNVYVYTENQQNSNLTQQIWAGRLNRLPAWEQNMADNWQLFEFDEEAYHTFEQGENFSIIYGVCPGGDQRQQGTGFWPIVDGETQVRRSYIAQVAAMNTPPPTNHANWTNGQTGVQLDADLLIRANGEYLDDFFDGGVIEVFNGDPETPMTGQFFMYPETEQIFKAQVANYGQDVDAALLTFSVHNADGEEVWMHDMIIENFAAGDTIVVESDSAWSTDTPGRYTVWALIQIDSDSNVDNDLSGLDQIVFSVEGENADTWLGYCDEEFETSTSGTPGDLGWAEVVHHPGGDQLLWVTAYRTALAPTEGEHDVIFTLAKLNLEQRQLETLLVDTLTTDGSANAQWLGRDLEPEEYITFGAGEAIMLTYISAEGVRILIDANPPISGSNNHMPWAMMITFDGGQQYYGAGSGDYAMQMKLGMSDELPEGARLRITPEVLEFGYVPPGEARTIDAEFLSYGQDTVMVTNIQISPAIRNFISVSQNAFAIPSLEYQIVSVTFQAPMDTVINSLLRVSSNSSDMARFDWRVTATTRLSVNDHVKAGIPGDYAMDQNFPNPFNPTTTIGFALPTSSNVSFRVFDMEGRQVNETYTARMDAGYHSFDFDATSLPAGVYTYKLTAGAYTSTKKMVLMK